MNDDAIAAAQRLAMMNNSRLAYAPSYIQDILSSIEELSIKLNRIERLLEKPHQETDEA